MSEKINLGLDLGTNSIGWALIKNEFEKKSGEILGIGSRIIPMSQDVLGKFDSGVSFSQTAERTNYRSVRRLYQRDNLRRERLHRVLNKLNFLPEHYANAIDFEKKLGQFKEGVEPKLNYRIDTKGKHEFIFKDSFYEMADAFKEKGLDSKIPFDWTIYYLRKKALTEKISKEELAWILLNFNQKRGYYQLRGEEEEIQKDKTKEFIELKVDRLEDTSETIKKTGDKLFEVYFTNGWKYDKPIVKKENWLGKSKEFIVTSTIKKDGEIKRSFKAVNSEEDWLAIKTKTQQDIESSDKTVGEYIFDALLADPKQKIRGKLIKTIERKFYKEELKAILKKQIEFHPELQNRESYKTCVLELYPRNEAHQKNIKDKGFEYLFVEDIIFYQRPLKSKKSTIGACQYERKYFKQKNNITGEIETVSSPINAISKSHPLFQEFRLWQFLRNLKVYKKEEIINGNTQIDVDQTATFFKTEEDWVELFDFLNSIEKIEQHQLLKYLSDKKLISKQNKVEPEYRWNYVEDKNYPCNETRALILKRLSKVEGLDALAFLTPEKELNLWHIIYSVNDKKEFEKALETFAQKNDLHVASFVESFKRTPPFKSDYGSYSEKAIKKLLPLMRIGKYWNEGDISSETKSRIANILERLKEVDFDKDKIETVTDDDIPKRLLKSFSVFQNSSALKGLNTYQACYAVYNRHAEAATVAKWKTPEDINIFLESFKQHSLRNPIVEQVVTETLRVVRDIWKKHGDSKPDFFSEIHLELGREMKNSKKQREGISKRNTENQNTNARIKALLQELKNDPETIGDVRPFSPQHQEILKLYEEGVSQNSGVSYSALSENDIDKIRKTANPTPTEITRYKLWLQQGYQSPYTGEIIPLSQLFTSDYQIEHIIPQSRYFDDSLSNKVICESEINPKPYKDNQTGFEFIKNMGGQIVPELSNSRKVVKLFSLKEYENHCNKNFKQNRSKLKNLLSEDIPEGFINRQLNDSRYISKYVKGLLSNIVRANNEQEPTSKNLISVTGAITSKIKQDWGLNDKWNELIAPRFERMNELTKSNDYGFLDEHKINGVGTGKKFFRLQVPEAVSRGFSKKRIDHRHHALDALVIACVTRKHINYLNALNAEKENFGLRDALLLKSKKGHYTKSFLTPWDNFVSDAKTSLETTVISFKQNKRVINKTNNKTWQWKLIDGNWKKVLVKQTKGDSWAVRKSMHKETVSGKIDIKVPKGKVATATRVSLGDIKNEKHLDKITDASIQVILKNHLNNYKNEKGGSNFEEAFNSFGIEELNKNIKALNNGKNHQPIYKVRLYETGSKFAVGLSGNNPSKYVEAAQGTNLFFAIYWDEKKQKRVFDTIPLNVVIEHQKQVADLNKEDRTEVPIDHIKGQFKFSLSPNDLVFVPNEEEANNSALVDFTKLTKEQTERIYKMVSCTGKECHFIQNQIASLVKNYDSKSKIGEFGSLNKSEISFLGERIKEVCWKLQVDNLGNVLNVLR
mgnify:CR=1 FL=1